MLDQTGLRLNVPVRGESPDDIDDDGDADGPAGAHPRSEAATAELHRLKEGWVQS